MIAVLQRVREASVTVEGAVVGAIGIGLLVLLGVRRGDDEEDVRILADRTAGLRIFPDDSGRMNRSLLDVGGAALVVSQFTLLADVRHGRRPGFDAAERPERAALLVERYAEALTEQTVRVERGRFGASMDVQLVNDGPVTILLDSALWRGTSPNPA